MKYPRTSHASGIALVGALGLALVLAQSCDDGGSTTSTAATGGSGTTGKSSSTGKEATSSSTATSTGAFSTGASMGPYNDFPSAPVIDGTAPADSATLFGPAGSGAQSGGPCLTEPEVGSLFPNNWLRPRFAMTPGTGQNLFEIRLHAASQVNDLVVYTTNTTWTMPKNLWTDLAVHSADDPITITIRSAAFDGTALTTEPMLGSTGPFMIAPVAAEGSIVYWTTSGGSALKGFKAGDEGVVTALQPPQVQMKTVGGAQVSCIGCHTSTPDGLFAGFVAQGPWGNVLGSVDATSPGSQPSFMGAGALAFLGATGEMGIQTYSKAHWQAGDHVMVTPIGTYADSKLHWVDLEAGTQAAASGEIVRVGDPSGVGAPAWTHDGTRIVYVSTNAEITGRLDNGPADLYSVPYNNRAGGAATPIPGASDPNLEEFYPSISADDTLVAFNRIPTNNNMYNNPLDELYVIPIGGGTATRLDANDPPTCSGKTSPGVTNSWPKWAPTAKTGPKGTYHWLVYSSTRGANGIPQLYITGVLVPTGGGPIESFSSIYLWNQPAESNHTPAWDVFDIPTVPPQ